MDRGLVSPAGEFAWLHESTRTMKPAPVQVAGFGAPADGAVGHELAPDPGRGDWRDQTASSGRGGRRRDSAEVIPRIRRLSVATVGKLPSLEVGARSVGRRRPTGCHSSRRGKPVSPNRDRSLELEARRERGIVNVILHRSRSHAAFRDPSATARSPSPSGRVRAEKLTIRWRSGSCLSRSPRALRKCCRRR